MKSDQLDRSLSGILLIDKPAGPTSFGVVRRIKRALRVKRVGHTGTLDPNATGLLVICINKATKLVPFLQAGEKEYTGSMILGLTTDTDDITGKVIAKKTNIDVSADEVEKAAKEFLGTIDQVPPQYAATKYNGEPGYVLARRGEKVPVRVRQVTVHELEVTSVEMPRVFFTVRVSKGTYVRSLVTDWGLRLNTGACLESLKRVTNGSYHLDQAISLEEAEELAQKGGLIERIIPLENSLPFMPEVSVPNASLQLIKNGQPIPLMMINDYTPEPGPVKIIEPKIGLLAIYEFLPQEGAGENCLKPVKVFAQSL